MGQSQVKPQIARICHNSVDLSQDEIADEAKRDEYEVIVFINPNKQHAYCYTLDEIFSLDNSHFLWTTDGLRTNIRLLKLPYTNTWITAGVREKVEMGHSVFQLVPKVTGQVAPEDGSNRRTETVYSSKTIRSEEYWQSMQVPAQVLDHDNQALSDHQRRLRNQAAHRPEIQAPSDDVLEAQRVLRQQMGERRALQQAARGEEAARIEQPDRLANRIRLLTQEQSENIHEDLYTQPMEIEWSGEDSPANTINIDDIGQIEHDHVLCITQPPDGNMYVVGIKNGRILVSGDSGYVMQYIYLSDEQDEAEVRRYRSAVPISYNSWLVRFEGRQRSQVCKLTIENNQLRLSPPLFSEFVHIDDAVPINDDVIGISGRDILLYTDEGEILDIELLDSGFKSMAFVRGVLCISTQSGSFYTVCPLVDGTWSVIRTAGSLGTIVSSPDVSSITYLKRQDERNPVIQNLHVGGAIIPNIVGMPLIAISQNHTFVFSSTGIYLSGDQWSKIGVDQDMNITACLSTDQGILVADCSNNRCDLRMINLNY